MYGPTCLTRWWKKSGGQNEAVFQERVAVLREFSYFWILLPVLVQSWRDQTRSNQACPSSESSKIDKQKQHASGSNWQCMVWLSVPSGITTDTTTAEVAGSSTAISSAKGNRTNIIIRTIVYLHRSIWTGHLFIKDHMAVKLCALLVLSISILLEVRKYIS